MAGKGDKIRKGADLKKFRENYDRIDWSKRPSPKQQQKHPQ